jgi:RNA polymerase sigma factor (sigma-70 family)
VEERPSDAQLIVESTLDPERFEVVFARHFDAIRDYLQRRAGANVGEELAAQTFLVAFDRRGTYDRSYASARAWLFAIATNLTRHHYRDEAVRLRALARARAWSVEEPAVEAESRLDAERAYPRIARALMELQAGDRDVLMLFALAELSYEEIARALSIPTGTVRSRLHRARRILREQLGPLAATHVVEDDPSGGSHG